MINEYEDNTTSASFMHSNYNLHQGLSLRMFISAKKPVSCHVDSINIESSYL